VDRTTVEVASVVFAATFVRSALGFGEALFSVPLLALLIPVTVAAPIAALVSITVAAVVLLQDWRHVHVRSASRLVASTLFGIPLGLILLTHAPEPLVKGVLASIIITFAAYWMVHPAARLPDDRWAWLFGFGAGILGGAYGMNGPPLAIYGSLRSWTPGQFRATLQSYFLPASAVGMCGYWLAGLWTTPVTRLYLASLPFVALAIVLGRQANRRLRADRFIAVVFAGLLVIGAILLVQALSTR